MSHPTNRYERQQIRKNKVLRTKRAKTHVQTKARKQYDEWPGLVACPDCREPMELVSIELGYQCTNTECSQHVEETAGL